MSQFCKWKHLHMYFILGLYFNFTSAFVFYNEQDEFIYCNHNLSFLGQGASVETVVRKHGDPEVTWTSNGMLRLSPAVMRRLFLPTVNRIKQAIGDVLNDPRLVGRCRDKYLGHVCVTTQFHFYERLSINVGKYQTFYNSKTRFTKCSFLIM